MNRRNLLQSAAALAAGLVAAGPARAQTRTPFTVAPMFIPIPGGDQLFPVRRIRCIGRNYASISTTQT